MLAQDLYELLCTTDSGAALRKAIAPGMAEYRRGLSEPGGSAPVLVESDGSVLVIATSHLVSLCEAFVAGQLDAVELECIATALEAAPEFRFVSKNVEECAFLLANPQASGVPSTETIAAVLRVLREFAA